MYAGMIKLYLIIFNLFSINIIHKNFKQVDFVFFLSIKFCCRFTYLSTSISVLTSIEGGRLYYIYLPKFCNFRFDSFLLLII